MHHCLVAVLELVIYLYLKLDHDFTSDGFVQCDLTALNYAILADINASKVKNKDISMLKHIM